MGFGFVRESGLVRFFRDRHGLEITVFESKMERAIQSLFNKDRVSGTNP